VPAGPAGRRLRANVSIFDHESHDPLSGHRRISPLTRPNAQCPMPPCWLLVAGCWPLVIQSVLTTHRPPPSRANTSVRSNCSFHPPLPFPHAHSSVPGRRPSRFDRNIIAVLNIARDTTKPSRPSFPPRTRPRHPGTCLIVASMC
jgi:hypothetical protein